MIGYTPAEQAIRASNPAESDRQAVQLMNIGRDMIAHPNRAIPPEAATAIEAAILAYARLVDGYVKAVAA